MTIEEYQRICDQLARKAVRFAAEKVANEEPSDLDAQCEHWIGVFLDEQLPPVDPAGLSAVTSHVNAYQASTGHPAPSPGVAALHAFQADVWDAINRMETTAEPGEEETVARGMLRRYRSTAIAMEMAHWHAMDHAEGSAERSRWLRVRATIERLSKETK